MIELVLLGSLILLGLHVLTRERAPRRAAQAKPAPPRRKAPAREPAPVRELFAGAAPRAPARRPRDKTPKPGLPPDADCEFEITCRDEMGTVRSGRIAQVRHDTSGGEIRIHCYWEPSASEVTLKNSDILSCRNLRSGRAIKDLGRYCQARRGKGPLSRTSPP